MAYGVAGFHLSQQFCDKLHLGRTEKQTVAELKQQEAWIDLKRSQG